MGDPLPRSVLDQEAAERKIEKMKPLDGSDLYPPISPTPARGEHLSN